MKVKANYSFWKYPIKWIRERKVRKLLEVYLENEWKNGLGDKVYKANLEMMLYGQVLLDKKGDIIEQNKLENLILNQKITKMYMDMHPINPTKHDF